MMPSIKEQLSKKIEKIEQTIDFYLPEEKGLQKTVLSAMNYSVKAGGKRLRPMLMADYSPNWDGLFVVCSPSRVRLTL